MDYQGYDRDFKLTGKVALITGGAAGIGKAIATLYALKGASLILADINLGVHDTKDVCQDSTRIEAVIGDITKAADREKIVQTGIKKFGKIDILVNNAGIALLETALEVPELNWDRTAIIGITKVLAVEWAKYNIQVNAISPTVTLTELGKKAWAGEVGEEFKRKLPAGRFADPDEIAACALFLSSNATDMITGSNLVIDGGYTIQ